MWGGLEQENQSSVGPYHGVGTLASILTHNISFVLRATHQYV